MIKTVKQACRFNPIIRDYRMSQGIENLADLINDAGDGGEFFSRNFVTHGMDQLFREGLLRLSGKSDQAVFELTQAMGGGKTHMMIALGLLARHPHLRKNVLPADLASRVDFGQARIAAFNGRNNPDNFIWGEIATQLGAAEDIKPYWANGPKAVDQRQFQIGSQDQQRHAGKARAGADIRNARIRLEIRRRRQRVEKVLFRDVLRLRDRGEVHARVPVREHGVVGFKLRKLAFCQVRSQGRQYLFDHARSSGCCFAA